ncbi:MAG: hypothetical protein U0L48_01190, partial [Acutalibacteraceae bacterium]|nr:hypothetical protein [Acutalibacteraceae bacterium]
TGVVLYKLDDASTTIVLDASNFSKDADAATRVANIIYIDAGTTDTGTGTYIDEIYYKYKYDVTIDGIDVGDFNSKLGTEYTLPQNSADGFIAYTDGTDGYDAGTIITVDKDYDFTTVAVGEVKMLKGAAMRYTDGTGIRFYTDVDTDKINALLTAGYEVTAGTLISPEDLVGGYDLNHKNYQSGYISAVMDVTYDLAEGYYTDDTTPDPSIVGSIVKIQDYNIARNFIGRGYVTVTVGDITKTVYADYADGDVANNTRNIQWIAQRIQNDPDVYPTLEDFKKEIVVKYANYGLETAEEAKI